MHNYSKMFFEETPIIIKILIVLNGMSGTGYFNMFQGSRCLRFSDIAVVPKSLYGRPPATTTASLTSVNYAFSSYLSSGKGHAIVKYPEKWQTIYKGSVAMPNLWASLSRWCNLF